MPRRNWSGWVLVMISLSFLFFYSSTTGNSTAFYINQFFCWLVVRFGHKYLIIHTITGRFPQLRANPCRPYLINRSVSSSIRVFRQACSVYFVYFSKQVCVRDKLSLPSYFPLTNPSVHLFLLSLQSTLCFVRTLLIMPIGFVTWTRFIARTCKPKDGAQASSTNIEDVHLKRREVG